MLATINITKYYESFTQFMIDNSKSYNKVKVELNSTLIKVRYNETERILRMQEWFYVPVKDIFFRQKMKEFEKKDGNKNKDNKSGRSGVVNKGHVSGHVRGSGRGSKVVEQSEGSTETERQGTEGTDMETTESGKTGAGTPTIKEENTTLAY